MLNHSQIKKIAAIFCGVVTLNSTSALAQAETPKHDKLADWLDIQHGRFSNFLNHKARSLDKMFTADSEALSVNDSYWQVRLNFNQTWDRFQGFKIEPKINSKIKLRQLEHRLLYFVLGDDTSDDKMQLKNTPKENENESFRSNTQRDNAGAALQLEVPETNNLNYRFNLGFRRITDLYARFRVDYYYQISKTARIDMTSLVRFGTKSKLYNLNSLSFQYSLPNNSIFTNLSEYSYSKKNAQIAKDWGNSSYITQYLNNERNFSYGFSVFGNLTQKKLKVNSYGPFVSYRQPLYKDWSFIEFNLNYFNDKELGRHHYPRAGIKIEILF